MALKNIVMPQAGQDLETGIVREWLKQVGDPVRKGEPIVTVETEKITLEVESPMDGVLRRIVAPADSEVAIFAVIGIVGGADDELP
jgi:pyruvate dehydrogenase E2 component (dihydrolipoamide acetyltransferase)